MTEKKSLLSLPEQLFIKPKGSSTIADVSVLPKIKHPKWRSEKMSKQLKKILKPRNKSIRKYFTAAAGINEDNAVNLDKEPSPYKYPEDLERFAYKVMQKAWRDDVRTKELKSKCYQKLSYQDKQRKGLLNRLYVKEPKVVSVKTVLDIDPQYFSIIEGRPIPDNLDIRTYIDLVRETLRTKIICGYREDDIMLIEENLLLEQQMIDEIRENLQGYINTFEEFLYRDHTSAMDLLKESQMAANEAYSKYEQYKAIAKEYAALRSSVYKSEEKWKNCKLYEHFLYTISPMSWKHDQNNKRTSLYISEDDPNDNDIFGHFRMTIADAETSLTNIISAFRQEMAEAKEPALYFSNPEELMDVFRFIEMQNLHSLLHSEELALPLDNVKEGMRVAERKFDEEIKVLREAIDRLSGGIRWEEERATYLEDFAKGLIENEFRALIETEDVLNLHVFVEDVYETRIGPNDANLSMLEMMKGIEEQYRNELLMLDKVPSEQVVLLEGSCYDEQMRIMRLAEKAAKQYLELERLTYKLNIAVGPSFKKKLGKELKQRSPPLEPPKKVIASSRRLTEAEEEYLEYFTDFCKFTDDPKDYGIDTTGQFERESQIRQGNFVKRVSIKKDYLTTTNSGQCIELRNLREMIMKMWKVHLETV